MFEDNAEFGLGMRRAFQQRRDHLMIQVEDTLNDKSVKMNEKLQKLLQQFLIMRKEKQHDLLLPRGRSIYHQALFLLLRSDNVTCSLCRFSQLAASPES